jgi:capsular polysaccharide biosynthesis protein
LVISLQNRYPKILSLSKASTAGIFNVEVKCSDAEYCSAAIRVVNKEFPDYLKSFDPSLGVVIVNDPNSPLVSNATTPLKLALLGFLFGALIVMIIIYISELVRDTVKSTDDIRLRLSIRVLGAMPTVEHNTRASFAVKPFAIPC